MATASSTNRAPREVVDFPTNTPVTVSLKYGQGRTISNQHGERMMYSLTDGRVMFLDLYVAGQIASAGINVGELFTITRKPSSHKGTPATWEVARKPGEQPNGTLVLQTLAPAQGTPETEPVPRKPVEKALVDEANDLVDAFAQVLDRSLTVYQGRVKPDEVKALLVTAYIQRQKLSSVA